MSTEYAIMRMEKIKTRKQINDMIEHNLRLRSQFNIVEELSKNNRVLVNKLNFDVSNISSFQYKLTDYYKEKNIKEKKDNSLLIEFVVSASNSFFENLSDEDFEEWLQTQNKFFEDKYGDKFQALILHSDETTKHVHGLVSTEIYSTKKYKNRHGSCEKTTWSLSCEQYNPKYLSDLQTEYAQYNEKFGLKRGIKGSKTKNVPLKQYYKILDKSAKEMENLLKLKGYYPKLRDKIIEQDSTINYLIAMLENKLLTEEEQDYISSLKAKAKSPKKTL